ncbi:hypothetical protein P43SY_009082 [Pythium insidiosum]|uniref:Uncharacterized protein n=1 Tax=Pythium insidiosum TaxID=114742 RepID=A0AAD5LNP3_PYTIN|nr:hypothetical protein P43SY_009082 [Pythium insidiosum]
MHRICAQALLDFASVEKKQLNACYENIKGCATAQFGCKRDLFAQMCTVCDKADAGCEKAPDGFTFPTLAKAVGAAKSVSSSGSKESPDAEPAPTPTPAPTPAPTPTPTPTSGAGAALVSVLTTAAAGAIMAAAFF